MGFTKPKNCCLCIDVRIATWLIALCMVLGSISEITVFAVKVEVWRSPPFYVAIVRLLFGFYGFYAVYNEKSKMVKNFAELYWGTFVVYVLGYLAFIIIASIGLLAPCEEVKDIKWLAEQCNAERGPKYVAIAIITTCYVILGVIQMHFGYAIKSYAKRLRKEEQGAGAATV